MVLTRSQTSRSNQLDTIDMDYISDNESEACFPECNSRGFSNSVQRANLLDFERDHERRRNEQRFIEMNNQVREITSIVNGLGNQIIVTDPNNERNTLYQPRRLPCQILSVKTKSK